MICQALPIISIQPSTANPANVTLVDRWRWNSATLGALFFKAEIFEQTLLFWVNVPLVPTCQRKWETSANWNHWTIWLPWQNIIDKSPFISFIWMINIFLRTGFLKKIWLECQIMHHNILVYNRREREREDESRNRAICSPCCVAGSKEALKIKNNPLTM